MEQSESSRRDRVYIDDSVLQIYKDLTEGSNPEEVPFITYKDVFLLAACLGFQSGRRKQVTAGSKTTIRLDVFREEGMSLLKAIAIAETGDVGVLRQLGDVLSLAEEYAHTGIYDVKAQLLDERGRPLRNLVDLINFSNRIDGQK